VTGDGYPATETLGVSLPADALFDYEAVPSATYAYQWQACDSSGACADIPGATSSSYTTNNPPDSCLQVIETATLPSGNVVQAVSYLAGESSPTDPYHGLYGLQDGPGPVAPTSACDGFYYSGPAISGIDVHGQTLASSTGVITGTGYAFSYQWQRCSATGTDCVDISGATSSSYLLQESDVGHTLRSTVTATGSNDGTPVDTSITSAQTPVIADVLPTVSITPSIYAFAPQEAASGASAPQAFTVEDTGISPLDV
jgi:hypothetical protein